MASHSDEADRHSAIRIRKNVSKIKDTLSPDIEPIIDKLIEKNYISPEQKDRIDSECIPAKKVDEVLKIIMSHGYAAFSTFMDILIKRGYSNLERYIMTTTIDDSKDAPKPQKNRESNSTTEESKMEAIMQGVKLMTDGFQVMTKGFQEMKADLSKQGKSIEQLQKQTEGKTKENEELKKENEKLKKENEQLKREISLIKEHLKGNNTTANNKITELEKELERANNKSPALKNNAELRRENVRLRKEVQSLKEKGFKHNFIK